MHLTANPVVDIDVGNNTKELPIELPVFFEQIVPINYFFWLSTLAKFHDYTKSISDTVQIVGS